MTTVAYICLGVAFLVAGGAKLAAPSWPAQAHELGAPGVVIPFVPWVEIIVGALLCVQLVRPVPAIIALAMLVVFTGLLVLRLAQGKHPPCACFGSWSARPLGWRHLVRNAVLMALAVIAIAA